MAYTLEKCFDDFLKCKSKRNFSTGVQAAYFAILSEFYIRDFPETVTLPVRDLGASAGLSVGQAHTAKNILKNNGLVDFHNECGRTVFKLGTERSVASDTEQSTEQRLNTRQTNAERQGLVCYTPAQENGVSSTLPLPPKPPIPNPKTSTESQQANQQASKQASLAEDVVELWERKTGTKLEDGEKVALRTFDELYGRETIKVAIATYAYKKGRKFSFFVEWCLKPLLASSSVKGGEDNGEARTNQPAQGKGRFDDEEPDTDWIHSSQTKD